MTDALDRKCGAGERRRLRPNGAGDRGPIGQEVSHSHSVVGGAHRATSPGKSRKAFSLQYLLEAITFLLVVIAIGDTLASGVLERTREFGMMRRDRPTSFGVVCRRHARRRRNRHSRTLHGHAHRGGSRDLLGDGGVSSRRRLGSRPSRSLSFHRGRTRAYAAPLRGGLIPAGGTRRPSVGGRSHPE